MKIIKNFFYRPYLVILIAIIITLIFPERYILHSLVLICVFFTISIIYLLIQKKWLRFTLSVLGYFFFIILWVLFQLSASFGDAYTNPETKIGDSKFYSNEILNNTNIKMPKDLKIISKLDTIVYMGIEGEYNAECLYSGSKNLILELENKINTNKEFKKVDQLQVYPTNILSQENFNINELKSVYKKESEGRYIIYIAFSNTKLYYSAFYY